jgi:hypothetical protein
MLAMLNKHRQHYCGVLSYLLSLLARELASVNTQL